MSCIVWAEMEGRGSCRPVNLASHRACLLCGSWWMYSALRASQLSLSADESETNISPVMQTAVWCEQSWLNSSRELDMALAGCDTLHFKLQPGPVLLLQHRDKFLLNTGFKRNVSSSILLKIISIFCVKGFFPPFQTLFKSFRFYMWVFSA